MSTHSTPNSPPPSTNPVAVVNASLQTLLIAHTFLVLLIPLLGALFYYSTPYSRRQPIFILNVIAITIAIIVAVVSDAAHTHAVLSPQNRWSPRFQLFIGFSGIFQSMLADSILLVRLITVHPLSRLGHVRFALLVFLPVTLKVTRVVNITLLIYRLNAMVRGPNAFQNIHSAWLHLPYMKIEWIAQVVDNSYASVAFLWTIRSYRVDTTQGLMSGISFRQSSFSMRMRILFRLALSNFIIPTVISIVQLAVDFQTNANPVTLNDITSANVMVTVVGVVFATVWAGKERRQEAEVSPNDLPLHQEQRNPRTGRMASMPSFVRRSRDRRELSEEKSDSRH